MSIVDVFAGLWSSSGLSQLFTADGWKNLVMIIVALVFLFLAIHPKFRFEPLLLVPIAF